MTTNYSLTLIIRQIMCWVFIGFNLLMWKRDHSVDASRNVFNILINFVLVILVEVGNYCQVRSKARLFLRVKATAMHERQLSNLLDAVPDKVLICSRA